MLPFDEWLVERVQNYFCVYLDVRKEKSGRLVDLDIKERFLAWCETKYIRLGDKCSTKLLCLKIAGG